MEFVFRAPEPPLDALVSLLWFARRADAPALETVLPAGRPQLVIQLDGRPNRWHDAGGEHREVDACLGGPALVPVGLPGSSQEAVAGALFHPGGLAAMVAVPVRALQGTYVPIRKLWGPDTQRWIDAVQTAAGPNAALRELERGLRSCVRRPGRRTALERACVALASGTRVSDVAAQLGASQRRFSRTFTDEVGLTPKQYTRLARFRRAIAHIRAGAHPDLTEVALSCGFYDQAHLTHEFRTFAGITPSAYRAASGPYESHVAL